MKILKIYVEEQLLIMYYVIKHLILLKILNMLGTKELLLQWFKRFFDKKATDTYANKSAAGAITRGNILSQKMKCIYNGEIVVEFKGSCLNKIK